MLGPDRLGAGLHLCWLLAPTGLTQQGGIVLQGRGHVGMVWSQGFLRNRQRPIHKRFCLGVLALGILERRQVVEAPGHVGMLRTLGLLPDRQPALEERLGLGIPALVKVEFSQAEEARG